MGKERILSNNIIINFCIFFFCVPKETVSKSILMWCEFGVWLYTFKSWLFVWYVCCRSCEVMLYPKRTDDKKNSVFLVKSCWLCRDRLLTERSERLSWLSYARRTFSSPEKWPWNVKSLILPKKKYNTKRIFSLKISLVTHSFSEKKTSRDFACHRSVVGKKKQEFFVSLKKDRRKTRNCIFQEMR